MKNKVKITTLILALMVSIVSIVGCSNNSSTSTEASVLSNVSTETSTESSIEESSISESSAEISYKTTSTAESSVSSNSSAIDPDVEERSYNKDEQTKFQSTRILNYKYYPYNKTYYYKGNESTITIPEVFSECPHIMSDTVKEIIVPETIKKITTDAFTGCPNLEKLVILNPDCEFDVKFLNSGVGYPPEILSNSNVNIYLYCHSDKTPADKSGNRVIPKSLTSSTAKFFSANYSTLLIHDLASESYE